MTRPFLPVLAVLLIAPLVGAAAAPASPPPDPATAAAIVAERLDATLASRGDIGRHEVKLDYPMLLLPHGVDPQTVRIENLQLDRATGRLSATLAPPASAGLRIEAQVFLVKDIVVPARDIEPGEVIGAADLQRETVRLNPGEASPLDDPALLIGKTPRHPLRAQGPVAAADLAAPIVIHRGDLVTMVVEAPQMTLSAQGQALQDAAQDAAIRVSNTASKRIVEAVVIGPGTVSVAPPTVP